MTRDIPAVIRLLWPLPLLSLLLGTGACSIVVADQLSNKPAASSPPPSPCASCTTTSCCNQICTTLDSDPLNCGACGHACSHGRTCKDGRCSPGWKQVALNNAPEARTSPCVAWSGSRILVWGGQVHEQDSDKVTDSGGRYDPIQNQWSSVSTLHAPSPRAAPICVGIGNNRVFVWGGTNQNGTPLRDGAIYDTQRDSWNAISLVNPPPMPTLSPPIWTGRQVLLW